MKITQQEIIQSLSFKQPLASLMMVNRIDVREWQTDYRGLVLLCASRKPFDSRRFTQEVSNDDHMIRIFIKLKEVHPQPNELYGKAFAIGRLVDCRPMLSSDEEYAFVPHKNGLFSFIYEDVKPIIPYIYQGHQGLKLLTEKEKQKIKIITNN